MKYAEATKRFDECLQQLAYTRKLWQVFNDFLDYSLLQFQWWDQKPEYYKDLDKTYTTRVECLLFAEAFHLLGTIADHDGEAFMDAFGDYYMEHFYNGKTGQYFTPQDICDLEVMISIPHDLEDGKSIYDPACGSGRLLLSAAKINRNALFYGSDIDPACCKMTALNFLLNTMCGEVGWMNTLSLEHWKSWHIKRVLDKNGHYLPYYTVSGPGETRFKSTIIHNNSENPEQSQAAEKTKNKKSWQKQAQQSKLQLNLFD